MFTDPSLFTARLSEVEKSKFRSCTDDGLMKLLFVDHRFEIGLDDKAAIKFIKNAKELLIADYAKRSTDPLFGSSWKF